MGILQTAERSSDLDPSENVVFQRHLVAYKEAANLVNGTVLEVGNSTLFNSTVTDSDNDTLTYLWDFGDGNTTTVSTTNITRFYNSTGNFSVGLTVSDPYGGSFSTNESMFTFLTNSLKICSCNFQATVNCF